MPARSRRSAIKRFRLAPQLGSGGLVGARGLLDQLEAVDQDLDLTAQAVQGGVEILQPGPGLGGALSQLLAGFLDQSAQVLEALGLSRRFDHHAGVGLLQRGDASLHALHLCRGGDAAAQAQRQGRYKQEPMR